MFGYGRRVKQGNGFSKARHLHLTVQPETEPWFWVSLSWTFQGVASALLFPADMALPFLSNRVKRIDQAIAIDLGGRQTKAVHVQLRNDRPSLMGYTIQDAPSYEKGFKPEVLVPHLKTILKAFGDRTRNVSLSIGVPDAFVRHAEMPPMPLNDMRQVLKLNSKGYLQQEFPDHVFDCSVILSKPSKVTPEVNKTPASPTGPQKQRVLVGGIKRQTLEDLKESCKAAGIVPHQITPGMAGSANAFELAEPDLFAKSVVALVDIGFKNTVITMLNNGELAMNRVVALGGDRITASLAETMGISYAEAEGIKVGMAQEVQSQLEMVLTPLGRELRASIDFFEHQQDVTVSTVYISGGSAQGESLLRAMQNEIMVPCKPWQPAGMFPLSLPPEQKEQFPQIAPQLVIALGAVASIF